MSNIPQEQTPLLEGGNGIQETAEPVDEEYLELRANHEKTRAYLASAVVFLFILAIVIAAAVIGDGLPRDPMKAAIAVLERSPVIDGHIDLPYLVRAYYANNVSALDLHGTMPGQVDITRLRDGHVGAFFWSVYTPCEESGSDFVNPTNSVRDTLEQIDVSIQMMDQYRDTFELATNLDTARDAMRRGKIAGFIGIEGAHQLSNSLGALRMYQKLGVKYVTLTHSCHNAFADSAGVDAPLPPRHGGLSPIGKSLVKELNRLGILVDLSHTSDDTARQALQLTQAPVIWSHSSARAVWNHTRNVPDDILEMIGETKGKTDAVVMVSSRYQVYALEIDI